MAMNKYKTVREKLIEKYKDAVTGIYEVNGDDVFVSFEKLVTNARAVQEGLEIPYQGAGDVNYPELIRDIEELYSE